jgi:T5SS/PEP-CTERM-associated repeat protein
MATDVWRGGGGRKSWFDAAHWSHGVPVDQQKVRFSGTVTIDLDLSGTMDPVAGATTVLGDTVRFTNGRTTLDAAQPKHGTTADLAIGGGGSVAIQQDTILAAPHEVQVGAFQAGALTAGALVVRGDLWANDLSVLAGTATIAGGSVTGDTQSLEVQVGASLTVQGGGTLGDGTAGIADLLIGSGGGPGSVLVSGLGSTVQMPYVDVGDGYSGTLTVAHGGVVDAAIVLAGAFGDGSIAVQGGGTLQAAGDIVLGGEVPVNSQLAVGNGGSVYAGTSGLILEEGKLLMQPGAALFGAVASLGGYLIASGPGTVTLGQPISLGELYADPQFGATTWAESQGGGTLHLAGRITADSTTEVLRIASGTVMLSNDGNSFGTTVLGDAKLLVSAPNAAGSALSFLAGDSSADLVLRTGFTDSIAGFAAGCTIDLADFAFAGGVSKQFHAGVLTLNNGSASTTLDFAGSYGTGNFAVSPDAGTGTLLTFASAHGVNT